KTPTGRKMPHSQQQVSRSSLSANRGFLKSFLGVMRLLQIFLGAGLWITIASNKYEGSIHFVLFVSVFFWLLTLALFFLTLLDKQDLVPLLGGDKWLLTNTIHDLLATILYLAASGVIIHKTKKNQYCNTMGYKHSCLYKVYLAASVFACLCSLAYLLTALYCSCRKCKGNQSLF
uniref:MARVEL domain containing 1 n=2 Tax=Latimeria chalumnae TaxID=7897 RepID=H3ANA2_LATCH